MYIYTTFTLPPHHPVSRIPQRGEIGMASYLRAYIHYTRTALEGLL